MEGKQVKHALETGTMHVRWARGGNGRKAWRRRRQAAATRQATPAGGGRPAAPQGSRGLPALGARPQQAEEAQEQGRARAPQAPALTAWRRAVNAVEDAAVLAGKREFSATRRIASGC